MSIRDGWFARLLWSGILETLDRVAVAQERTRLREMSESELSDIGLSRRDASCEAIRPFWEGRREA